MGGLSMDESFVQAPEHRPKPTVTEATGIPLIDLSPLSSGDAAAVDALAAEVGAASREWGFFLVVGHGVPAETVARAALRLRLLRAPGGAEGGRAQERGGAARVLRVGAHQERQGLEGGVRPRRARAAAAAGEVVVYENKWPEDLPGFREALEGYMEALEEMAFKLLELLARSLDLRPGRLRGFFREPTTFFRLNHYPPCPSPGLALGVGRHKDPGALTILYQDDVGGLDVRRRSDGEWARVKVVPGSFIINVGDTMQVWSNDRYESAEHRVSVNRDMARFSMPYFFNPAADAVVEPLEELVGEEDPPKYSAYSWGDFFRAKLSGNYRKKDVENLQIEHFRKGPQA